MDQLFDIWLNSSFFFMRLSKNLFQRPKQRHLHFKVRKVQNTMNEWTIQVMLRSFKFDVLLIQPIAHVALVQINQSFIFQQIHSLAVVWSERVCKVKVCVVFQYKHSKEAIFLGDLLIVLLSDHQIPQSKVISHHSQQAISNLFPKWRQAKT